jgi:NAD(P)H-flavin reductase
MASGIATIIELRLETNGMSGVISCPAGLRPTPGQYLAASSTDPGEAFATVIFPSRISNGVLSIAAPLPAHWKIGMQLALRGPLGKGFKLPAVARRVVLASPNSSPDRLLPLAYMALAQRAAVAIYAQAAPAGLPAEVEISPLDVLHEAVQWADFIALDTNREGLPLLREQLGLKPFERLSCPTQVLVTMPMPCCGLAECGVCAVHTQDGLLHACSDGPVFEFHQLDGSREKR